MKPLRYFTIWFLLSSSILSCKEPEANVDTPEYQREELAVYQQLLDPLLDSVGFAASNEGKLVFYLGDTLAGVTSFEGKEELITSALATRSMKIADLAAKSKHKFVRATDTLWLEPGDRFTSRWLRLSRVRFSNDRTSGFLSIGVYCGNLCSWTDSFYIEKKDSRWKISKVVKGPDA